MTVEEIIARAIPVSPDEPIFASGGTGAIPNVVHLREWQAHLTEASRVIAALETAGYVVVPKEATHVMCEVGPYLDRVPPITTSQAGDVWDAMIEARPK